MWVIYSVREKLWWSNDMGWVDEASATRFSWDERQKYSTPFGGVWQRTTLKTTKQTGFIS